MLCWVNLDLDSNVFPHIAQTFSDIVLTWQRLEQNWRYMCQKKVRVVLLSKFSKQKLPSVKTVHFLLVFDFHLGAVRINTRAPAYILKARILTPTILQKKLNFLQICPKMPQNGPKMAQNDPKWPKNYPTWPNMALE